MKASLSKLVILFTVLIPLWAWSQAEVGRPAPSFEAQEASGKTIRLEDLKGKWIVLEWYNKDCPYVKKHYGSQNMQKLQKEFVGKGVNWYSVISSAKGKQGHLAPKEALANAKATQSNATSILIDEAGIMGRSYGAKTTPHMFVISPEGHIVYAGAIDDNDSADSTVIAKSKNHVAAALDEAMAGKKVSITSTRPYGCGVKYQ